MLHSKPSTILVPGGANYYLLALTGGRRLLQAMSVIVVLTMSLVLSVCQAATDTLSPQASQFKHSWDLARVGKHSEFRQQMVFSKDYLLYPYLQYEDYRSRLAAVPATELAAFLARTKGWAFNSSLRQAWLRDLGRRRQWQQLLDYAGSFKAI